MTQTDETTADQTSSATAGAEETWLPPAGIAPRGTLLVFPGRGEHAGVYERFGKRLAADGYTVSALPVTAGLDAEAALPRARALAGYEPAAPLVLVGSDTGALLALQTAAAADPELPVEGVVLAGTAPTAPVPEKEAGPAADQEDGDWHAELSARTSCPAHRNRITHDDAFVRGQLKAPVPSHLLVTALPALPVLLLHGDADPVTPVEQARALADRLPGATLGVLHEGVHDVLNDITHRTTAAAVVQWLERLRSDRAMTPLLTVEREPRPWAAAPEERTQTKGSA